MFADRDRQIESQTYKGITMKSASKGGATVRGLMKNTKQVRLENN